MRRSGLLLWLLLGCDPVATVADASAVDAREPVDLGSTFDAPAAAVDAGARDVPVSFPDLPVVAAAPDAGRPDVVAVTDVATTRTTLRVHYPVGTRALSLRGDLSGLSWDRGVTLTRVTADLWEWSSADVARAFEWKPLLDDREWSIGPNYRASPGATLDIYPRFVARSGRWSRNVARFHSEILGNDRGIWLYLPPAYDENPTARFPVVYMHDGQNLFDPSAAFGGNPWYAQDALNVGAENGSIREAIIVGVENTAARIDEYTPTRDAGRMAGGRGDLYLRMLVEEVKPMVDRTWRTLPGRADTVLVGSSLGGLISMYAGVRRGDVFGHIGSLSPSTWWDGRMILREVATLPTVGARPLRVYVDSGDAGDSSDGVADTATLAEALRTAGYRDGVDLRYLVQRGAAHNETWWAQRLPGALAFLLGPRDP